MIILCFNFVTLKAINYEIDKFYGKKDIGIEHMKLYKKGKTFAIYVRHANCKFTASMISLIYFFYFIPIMFSLRHDVFFLIFLPTHSYTHEGVEEV